MCFWFTESFHTSVWRSAWGKKPHVCRLGAEAWLPLSSGRLKYHSPLFLNQMKGGAGKGPALEEEISAVWSHEIPRAREHTRYNELNGKNKRWSGAWVPHFIAEMWRLQDLCYLMIRPSKFSRCWQLPTTCSPPFSPQRSPGTLAFSTRIQRRGFLWSDKLLCSTEESLYVCWVGGDGFWDREWTGGIRMQRQPEPSGKSH